MWIPVEMNIVDFMSHKDTKFKFHQGRVTVIIGQNEYDGQQSNESGKSVLIEGFCVAILGEPIRDVPLSDIVRNGEALAYVCLLLLNSVTGETLQIERNIHSSKNKPSRLELSSDNIDLKGRYSSVDTGNKLILELLGISRDDLLNYYIVSKKKYKSFYYASDKDKKDLIARFSKADRVNKAFDHIATEISKIEGQSQAFSDLLNHTVGSIEAYNNQLLTIQSPEDMRKAVIDMYDEELEEVGKNITKALESIAGKRILLGGHQSRLEGLKEDKRILEERKKAVKDVDVSKELEEIAKSYKEVQKNIKGVEDDIKIVEDNIAVNRESLAESEKLEAEMETAIAGSVTCPACSHIFLPKNSNIDMAKTKAMLEILKKKILGIDEEIKTDNGVVGDLGKNKEELEKSLESLDEYKRETLAKEDSAVKKRRAIQKEIDSKDEELQTCSLDVSGVERELKDLDKNILTYKSNATRINGLIELAKKKEYSNNRETLENARDAEIKKKDKYEEDIKNKATELVKAKAWQMNFKKFHTHLSNKSISSIELRTNAFLSKIGSPLSINVDGYKILASGEIRDKINISVNRKGKPEGNFNKCSEGAKARLDICTIIANQDFINMGAGVGKGLGVLVLDEITESVDSKGSCGIVSTFDGLGRTIIYITHADLSATKAGIPVIVHKGMDGISRIL